MNRCVLTFLFAFLFQSLLFAQAFNGNYSLQGNQLMLSQSGQTVTGTLQTTDGGRFTIQSEIAGGEALGSLTGPESTEFFGAYFEGGGLTVIIAPLVLGIPDLESGQLFQFQRSAAPAADPPAANSAKPASAQSTPEVAATPSTPVKPLRENGTAGLKAGERYSSGTRVRDSGSGVSFVLPEDWFGGVPANSDGFLLGSNTIAGVGIVYMRQQTTLQLAEQLLNAPQDLGDGVILQPTGEVKRSMNRIEIEYSNGTYFGKAIARVGKFGNGAAAFWAGPIADKQRYAKLTGQVAGSFKFLKPTKSSAAVEWDSWLRGTMLRQLSSSSSSGYGDGSYSGSSSSTTLHLCSNGRYSYSSSSSFSVDAGDAGFGYSGGGAYGQSGDSDSGTWKVQGSSGQVVLVLTSDEGGEAGTYVLSSNSENHTLVNGERYFRVDSDWCE
ncbi:MAG: hypothetical protein ACRBF0_00280 [Calditrichia bacterium]